MRPAPQCDNAAHDQLIERIATRYEQLEQELDELETKLREVELHEPLVGGAPRKPR